MINNGRKKKVELRDVEVTLFFTESKGQWHDTVHQLPIRLTVIFEYTAAGKKYKLCWPQQIYVTELQNRLITKTLSTRKVFRNMLSRKFYEQEEVKLSWDKVDFVDLLEVRRNEDLWRMKGNGDDDGQDL